MFLYLCLTVRPNYSGQKYASNSPEKTTDVRRLFFSFYGEILKTIKATIMIHDCIYQFLRLFYHSRFKPQQLEMTLSQLSAPALDLILVVPLILRLFKDFSRFSNETKMRLQSKPEINRKSTKNSLKSIPNL